MSGKQKNKLPKWFDGVIYDKGETITNPYTGDSYALTKEEISMYDLIKGAEMMISVGDWEDQENREELIEIITRGLDWFKTNNAEAYMVLLD